MTLVSTESEGEILIVAVYVDDIILGGKSDIKMSEVKKELSQKFEMKDLGLLHHFLGVNISQDQHTGRIWIGQPMYTEKLLQKFGMTDSKPVSTPVNPDVKLIPCNNKGVYNQKMYQAAIGSLLYLSTKPCLTLCMLWGVLHDFAANPLKNMGLL